MTALDLTLSRVTKLSLDPLPRAAIPLMRVYALWDAIGALSFHRESLAPAQPCCSAGSPSIASHPASDADSPDHPQSDRGRCWSLRGNQPAQRGGVGDPALLDKPARRIGRVLHWDPAVDWK